MRYNTSVDFIQASGGNVDHINHVKLLPLGDGFKPEGSSPILPSGSVWLRPNDGQLERLEYQGLTSSFQAQTAEGFAAYAHNPNADSTPLIITTENPMVLQDVSVIMEDFHFFTRTASLEAVIIAVSGVYRITASLRADMTGSQGGGEFALHIRRNGIDIAVRTSFVPVVGDGGGCHVSLNFVGKLESGDQISFVPTSTIAGTVVKKKDFCGILEFIRPLDLGAGSNIVP